MSFGDALRERICDPLGMNDTAFSVSDESIAARIENLVAEEHELRRREEADSEDAGKLQADRDRLEALEFWKRLVQCGVYVNLMLPPATPNGVSLIRCSVSAAHTEGSLVPSIKYVQVPNQRPPSREGHLFADNTEALIDAVSACLAEQHL